MSITVKMLNANQRRAFEWDHGPLLVLAGPGAGKTAILTFRIANLIKNSPNKRFRILGLTFTVKAATEMQNRINELLGDNTDRIRLRTFHSFCADLLRQHGSQLGLRPDFSIITDEKDRTAILGELQYEVGIDILDPEDSLKKIDIMLRDDIKPEDLPKYFSSRQQDRCRTLQCIFSGYVNKLVDENQLDFASMLYFTKKLLTVNPRIAKQVRTVYRYVCVDEFQDTNRVQYRVLRLIAPGTTANLFVVADEDQIIFQWNGANPKRLRTLIRDYNLKAIQLPENYRCPSKIVNIANQLISFNYNRITTNLDGVSQSNVDGTVTLRAFDNFEAEVKGLVARIETVPKLHRQNCIVIARSNKLLIEVKEAMSQKCMTAEIVSKHQNFETPLVRMLYFSLKLANVPNSRSTLNNLCAATSQIGEFSISAEDVLNLADVWEMSLLRVFFSLIKSCEALSEFASSGHQLLCDSLEYSKFVEESFREFDKMNITANDTDLFSDYVDDKNNWQRISREIQHANGESASLHVFLQKMDLSPKNMLLSNDCVRLQTVHTAKGTEFKNVFVIGLVEDQFPTCFAIKNGELGIQEERRNCFAAITRSSENLYLSYARNYFGWSRQPSRFLREMGLLDQCH